MIQTTVYHQRKRWSSWICLDKKTDMVVEQIHTSSDKKAYEFKNSQLQFLMDKNEKQVLNDMHLYINAEVNVMFTKMQESRSFNMFG